MNGCSLAQTSALHLLPAPYAHLRCLGGSTLHLVTVSGIGWQVSKPAVISRLEWGTALWTRVEEMRRWHLPGERMACGGPQGEASHRTEPWPFLNKMSLKVVDIWPETLRHPDGPCAPLLDHFPVPLFCFHLPFLLPCHPHFSRSVWNLQSYVFSRGGKTDSPVFGDSQIGPILK